jgi:hypothetical protein
LDLKYKGVIMLKELLKVASKLDALGLTKEADTVILFRQRQ